MLFSSSFTPNVQEYYSKVIKSQDPLKGGLDTPRYFKIPSWDIPKPIDPSLSFPNLTPFQDDQK
jgi:hypothetical protein